MAKLKNPLLGFKVQGTLTKALSFRHSKGYPIAENRPLPKDAKTPAQLSWRIMYQKAVDLWHALSPEEKTDWERGATTRHMTGFAWFMSQCLKPNPGIYLPLQGGSMQGDIDMATHKISGLPQPATDQEAATKKYVDDAAPAAGSKIADADGDTSWDTEEAPDEDKIHGKVKGVEAFLLEDPGILTLAKQSRASAYRATNVQSIPNTTLTKVQLNGEVYDTQSEFDPITNYRFTAKKAGLYAVSTWIMFNAMAAAKRPSIAIQKNGASIGATQGQTAVAADTRMAFTLTTELAATDFIELAVWHDHGAARDLNFGQANTGMTIAKIA